MLKKDSSHILSGEKPVNLISLYFLFEAFLK